MPLHMDMRAPPRSSLFSTVPQRDYLQFWQSGLFQPQRVARFLGLSKGELAQLAGVAPASVRFDDKAPRALRERLMELATTCELVAAAFEGNTTKTALWFMTPNPELNNFSPCDLLRRGNREILQQQILDAITEVSAAPVHRPKQGRALLASYRHGLPDK
jgi:hypothetical protein